jgi:hypothetical protein
MRLYILSSVLQINPEEEFLMKRKLLTIGATLALSLAFAGGASAHVHYITTPNEKHVIIPQEPDHVHDVTQSTISYI